MNEEKTKIAIELALRTPTGETCLQKLQIGVFTSRCSPHQQYDIF